MEQRAMLLVALIGVILIVVTLIYIYNEYLLPFIQSLLF